MTPTPSVDSAGSAESSANSSAPTSATPASGASSTSSISLASSFSGLSATGGDMIGKFSPAVTPGGKTESLDKLGNAVGQVASGQVSSALGVLGVGDSPGWLKGLSTFVSGVKVGKKSDGGAMDAGGVSPVSAVGPALSAAGGALGSVHAGGGAAPGPQVNYNIRTATVEDAFLASQRIEKEKAATNLARY
jgi:hypothetical protein